jgi:hypothetical protein
LLSTIGFLMLAFEYDYFLNPLLSVFTIRYYKSAMFQNYYKISIDSFF